MALLERKEAQSLFESFQVILIYCVPSLGHFELPNSKTLQDLNFDLQRDLTWSSILS